MNTKFQVNMEKLGISISKYQYNQFEQYYQMLVEWNKVMNLTSIVQPQDVFLKHFADSLAIVKVLDMKKNRKVIDVGTGAGFPGLPLKIAFPHLDVVLVDSLSKRITFLNAVKDDLDLTGIEAIHGRAEDIARESEYREKFDLCVSRAVSHLSVLSEYCLPFVRVGGMFVSYKSDNIENELIQSEKAIQTLGGKIEGTVKFDLLDTKIKRSFVKVKKSQITLQKYPRKSGTPERRPL